jgi:hypothetical protein
MREEISKMIKLKNNHNRIKNKNRNKMEKMNNYNLIVINAKK